MRVEFLIAILLTLLRPPNVTHQRFSSTSKRQHIKKGVSAQHGMLCESRCDLSDPTQVLWAVSGARAGKASLQTDSPAPLPGAVCSVLCSTVHTDMNVDTI